jgi:hypothetical protein
MSQVPVPLWKLPVEQIQRGGRANTGCNGNIFAPEGRRIFGAVAGARRIRWIRI